MTNERKADGENRIGDLPHDVLCHILSFLPSEEAIATCLSTRWRLLWTMVPSFDFDCSNSPKNQERINKFLSLRRTERITKFHLKCKCHQRFCSYNVKQWVSAAMAGKVEQLTTVVSLKLEGFFVLSVPSSVHLPSLKTLHLNVYQCADFKNFISGSPALELFYLDQLADLCFLLVKVVRNPRYIKLFVSTLWFEIVIKSDKNYDFISDYSEDHLENVVKPKVHITLYRNNPLPGVEPCLLQILKGLRNVEFLSLSDLRGDTDGDILTLADLPQFRNLVQLQLCVRKADSLFMELPAKCPKLQVVEFIIRDYRNVIDKRCRYHISGRVWEHDLSIVPVSP